MSPQEFAAWAAAFVGAFSVLGGALLKLWDAIDKRIAKREQRHRRSGQHRKPPKEREL
jgi:hypothetical protein